MRNRLPTICSLVAVGGILLWLNLRIPGPVAEAFNTNRPPEDVDPITKFLFFRGWPFTPCEYCYFSLSGWHPDGYVQLAAFADVLIFVLVLAITSVTCEWCCRFWNRR